MLNQLCFKKDYATIKEVKNAQDNNENRIRIYCSQRLVNAPEYTTFNFQIRTFKALTDFGKGKPRNMIANVSLNIKEVKEILKFMETYAKRGFCD